MGIGNQKHILPDLIEFGVRQGRPVTVRQHVVEDRGIGFLVQDQCSLYVFVVDPLAELCLRAADFLPDFERHFDMPRLALAEQPIPELRYEVEAVIFFIRSDQYVGIKEVEQSVPPEAGHHSASGIFVSFDQRLDDARTDTQDFRGLGVRQDVIADGPLHQADKRGT